ncbi:hypothetical protein GYMLUDRAFT_253069 [Collybiopsis luxurians FD-317 M1]|uniref:Uncharacterized protein n=1 Tax=Collybiopsis luxurians FD-317 M1 TaxID=944289 RepID=A0A0D0BLS2_9AGAR|nr:hypothetical protein GYMLUDRAFT_253069 [Collybiopsis luxurians FD-317 M1]
MRYGPQIPQSIDELVSYKTPIQTPTQWNNPFAILAVVQLYMFSIPDCKSNNDSSDLPSITSLESVKAPSNRSSSHSPVHLNTNIASALFGVTEIVKGKCVSARCEGFQGRFDYLENTAGNGKASFDYILVEGFDRSDEEFAGSIK